MKFSQIITNVNSWQAFQKKISTLSETEKGYAFEHLVKHYLLLDPKYTTLLRNVWLFRDFPENLQSKFRLPTKDIGIDIIAETFDGEYWAVQCKYRSDEDRPLTHRELSTFGNTAFALSNKFVYALVCTSADKFSTIYKNQDRIGFCMGEVWRSLDMLFFKQLKGHLTDKVKYYIPLKPYSHQKKAITNAKNHFIKNKHSRGKLIQPCGTGKSLTGFWINTALRSQNCIVALPSLALMKQTLNVWLRESVATKQKIKWLCVCSDAAIGQNDDIHLLKQDLGVPSTTNVNYISNWLKKNKSSKVIVFTTYQSGATIAKASRAAGIEFDTGIFDEAHKTVGSYDKEFSHLLQEKNIAIKKRIFMTATERRYIGERDKVASMDNVAMYGETFDLITYKDALESKPSLLSDYKVLTILVNKSEIIELFRNNNWVTLTNKSWNKEVDVHMLTALIALRKTFDNYPISHAISFHNGINRAKEFQELQGIYNNFYPESKVPEAFHVSGRQPVSKRAKIMESFAVTRTGLVTNARCLTEGIDIPKIDCVLFADPKRSVIDIVQAAGRALRKYKNKRYGYIVIPVLTEAIDQEIDDKAFHHILTVMRALASNDDRIIEYFRGENGKKKHKGLLEYNVSNRISEEISFDALVESMELKVWKKLGKLSWRPFEEARNFVHHLKLTSFEEWNEYHTGRLIHLTSKPPDIPASPAMIYKHKGWKGWGDWLGTFNPTPGSIRFRSFEAAREFARSLRLKNMHEWKKYAASTEKPSDIPASPAYLYKTSGWKGVSDWLGTGNSAPWLKQYRLYEEANKFVKKLGLRNRAAWTKYCKDELLGMGVRPEDIPISPHRVYKSKGWQSWNDWLGTNNLSNRDKSFLPFHEARQFAHSLGFKRAKDWFEYVKAQAPGAESRPANLPSNPNESYLNKGWIDWGDWLGTGTKHPSKRSYKTYKDAHAFVLSLGLKSNDEWRLYCKGAYDHLPFIPNDIPKTPDQKYKGTGWVSWGVWLGTVAVPNRKIKFKTFADSRKFVHSLHLSGESKWRKYCKGELPGKKPKPATLPSNPSVVYINEGWISWGDWLGINRPSAKAIRDVNFEEARNFVRSLCLKDVSEYKVYCKGLLQEKGGKPPFITTNPNRTYADQGWIGWGDWLGTGRIANFNIKYRSFEEARKFIRKLKLKSGQEWKKYCAGQFPEKGIKPPDIPRKPNGTYKNKGWISMGDWLGTKVIAHYYIQYRNFEQARTFARSLRLKNSTEWIKYSKGELSKKKKPIDIPASPAGVYKNKGWKGMGDWLGTGTHAPGTILYRPFIEAKKFVQLLGLKNHSDWKKYCAGKFKDKGRKPVDIPASPQYIYKENGWINMRDWLGAPRLRTNNIIYRKYEEAQKFVKELELANSFDWERYCKGKMPEKSIKPDDIPADPGRVYKNSDWKGFADWLGTRVNKAAFKVAFLPYEEAKKLVNSLGLKNQRQWRSYCKGELADKKPEYIPGKPERVYKDDGWTGLGDWLGTGALSPFPKYQPVYRQLRPYNEAKTFAKKLKLKSWKQWFSYCSGKLPHPVAKPQDIPTNPQRSYKNKGWTNWGDWLGTNHVATHLWKFDSFEKARRFARKLKLESSNQWFQFCWQKMEGKTKRPVTIPTNPQRTYKDTGWINWEDWLKG